MIVKGELHLVIAKYLDSVLHILALRTNKLMWDSPLTLYRQNSFI